MKLPSLGSISKRSILAALPFYMASSWIFTGGYKNREEIFEGKKPNHTEYYIGNKPDTNIFALDINDFINASQNISIAYDLVDKNNFKLENFDEKIRDFIDPVLKNNEIIGFVDSDKTGLKAVAFRDKETCAITIAFAGVQTNLDGLNSKIIEDFWDGFDSSAGFLTEQFPEALAFCHGIEKNFGKIDIICGHSLGGHLTRCLSPAFIEHENKPNFIVLDAPGSTKAAISDLTQFYSIYYSREVSEKEITSCSDEVAGFILNYNTYNTIGSQNKFSTTDLNNCNYETFSLKQFTLPDHFYQEFENHFVELNKKIEAGEIKAEDVKLYKGDNSKQSGAPLGAGSALILASILLYASPDILNALIKGGKKVYNGIKPAKKDNGLGIEDEEKTLGI
jgi:hypothetical protein